MKNLPTLYARTNTGAIQQWIIQVEGDRYRTVYGQVDGKQITTEWTVCYTTNQGRSNERTNEAQALFEAQALWKKRVNSGYHEDINDIDKVVFVEPMLAQKFEDRKDELVFPVYCQAKLDGGRSVTSIKGAFTRNGKQWKSVPHILYALEPVFEKYPDIIFDGELYTHEFHDNFEKIMSLVKKTKPTVADLKESAKYVQYHVYDLVDTTLIFSERIKKLNEVLKEFNISSNIVVPVDTYKCNNFKELDELYEKFLNDGYEGQMIRVDTYYENKRSKYLLKRKEFQDAEYKIIALEEGEGNKTGMAGNMILATRDGRTFSSNIKGDRDYLRELWSTQDELIGKLATVRFFHLTSDGIPRFPYVVGVRDGE